MTEVEDVSQMSGGILGGLRKGDLGGPVALTHVELLLIRGGCKGFINL